MKLKTYFTYTGFGLLVLVLSGCSLLPEKTVGEKVAPSVAQEQTKEYRSEFMKISLQIPKDWVVEEKANWAEIKSKSGKITFDKISTNWDTLAGYLSEIDGRRTVTTIDEKSIKINNLLSIRRIESFQNGPTLEEKVYFIYTNNLVFTLSTSTPELYDELDQIAQSFRYFGK